MRQGQQNRRGRGRQSSSSRGGKGQNPLTRSHESNGPDVKIRGTPSHIAEKYISLARDSLSAGDVVMAENYLQHAEHYNRIIMSYREQSHGGNDAGAVNGNAGRNGEHGRHSSPRDAMPATMDSEPAAEAGEASAAAAIRGTEPQPSIVDHPPVETGTMGSGRASAGREEGRTRRVSERGGRAQRGGARGGGRKAASGNADQPRSATAGRRRGGDSATQGDAARSAGSGGSKISDGQDPPGFLRNSVSPARRRRKADSEPEAAAVSAATAAEEDGA